MHCLFIYLLIILTAVYGDAIVGWFPAPVVGCTASPASVDAVSGDQATTVTPDPTTCYAGMAITLSDIIRLMRGFRHYVSILSRNATHRDSAGMPHAALAEKYNTVLTACGSSCITDFFRDVFATFFVERKTLAVRCVTEFLRNDGNYALRLIKYCREPLVV